MPDDAERTLCDEPYPEGGGLTCIREPGHPLNAKVKHVTCLGYHPEWEDENGLLHPGEYEYAQWGPSEIGR